jgi:hypothetical protein
MLVSSSRGNAVACRAAVVLLTLLYTASARLLNAIPVPTWGVGRAGRALLADQANSTLLSGLPLKVVTATPALLLEPPKSGKVLLRGAQTIQIVFSRPVIALGADFGGSVPPGQLPFTLSGGGDNSTGGLQTLPFGRFRWVTTYIARFDPIDGAWPTDLALSLIWNRQLTTWDGVTLSGAGMLQVRPH